MAEPRICILGGSGFVGRYLVGNLTRRGIATRVPSRRRERSRHLLVYPTCEVTQYDPRDRGALARQLEGCTAVVNLVGILNQGGGATFEDAHVRLAEAVVAACRDTGVSRIVHMSALHAAASGPSEYLKTKHRAEEVVHAAAGEGIAVTSLRPSVVFGPGDSFFNRFATLLAMSRVALPLACPGSRFAPVYVGDVAAAFVACLDDPDTAGNRYDLCGPRVYTLRELVEYTGRVAGLGCAVIGLGDGLSRLQARALELVPGKPFSYDNYLSLQVDSVCRGDDGLAALGITPATVESIVPSYLGHDDRMARYQELRGAARR